MRLDTVDHTILRVLQREGRISNADLAQRVRLSASACHRRVRLLEAAGVIQGYVALLSEAASNRPQTVFVQITLTSQEGRDLERFEADVLAAPEVMECYLMTGDADYMVRVVVRDAADYERLHREVLTRLHAVDRIKSSFALRTVRKKTDLPLD